ncbi:glyoxalase/bleomycin resistance/extradiol dioxygenase family protein [Oceanobacillus arenosus]|uniref:Glyoxalase/bleomycin resistance/extradiol dioxygenase family protein n=1 Tax=Oceanobacillus arenosus TaxID=1229153 RepID=A0A3D8PQ86_9BACI|nr:VOC family protein [Oceanobacillus arenosus]RDW17359.1 glyoxalase/bleomycin resistance/extradiol dioxygenase family protein [Oceanobacillus arenosus]
MINQVGQIMLYVNDQDVILKFWTEKLGFTIISEQDNGQGMRWIEIAPSKEAGTSIVLQNKKLVAEMEPTLNLGTPSLIFYTDDLEALYQDYKEKDITLGEMVVMPGGKVFNFADPEANYFAVMEKK